MYSNNKIVKLYCSDNEEDIELAFLLMEKIQLNWKDWCYFEGKVPILHFCRKTYFIDYRGFLYRSPKNQERAMIKGLRARKYKFWKNFYLLIDKFKKQ